MREHWDGLFAFGAPDVVVVNVTKDAIWIRDAALPGLAESRRPNISEMFPGGPDTMPDEMELPQPPRPRETQQDSYLREIEIDPHKYLPDDVYRDPVVALPDELKADLRPIKQALRDKDEGSS